MNLSIKAGSIIISTPALDDTYFEQTVILITEHNAKGTIGYIINKLHNRLFNELQEFVHCPPISIFVGGPVADDMLYCIHQQKNIPESILVETDIYYGGDFKKITEGLSNGSIKTDAVKLFIGYCGWDEGELAAEITEGSWQLTTAAASLLFHTNTTNLWLALQANQAIN